MSKLIPYFSDLEDYQSGIYPRDYHSVVTIQLCELAEGGFVRWYSLDGDGNCVPDREWAWDYYDLAQYKRVCDKFNARYWWDEISMLPPIRWKQQVVRKFNEAMPKYKLLYKSLEDLPDFTASGSEYGKSRQIYSEFPETLLNGNSDYVSNGSDREFETIRQGDWLEKALEFSNSYKDVDVMLLDELEVMFSQLWTVNANGF